MSLKSVGLIILISSCVLAVTLQPPVSGGRFIQSYSRDHCGKDIVIPGGTPVYPIAGGVIKETGYSDTWGNYIVISHVSLIESRYLHLNTVEAKTGTRVTQSMNIGESGSIDNSTDPYLHLEIRLGGIPLPPGLLLLPNKILGGFFRSITTNL
jgi:murein DD-endopeptidase MepM/ murein hydrolase activator NlpD